MSKNFSMLEAFLSLNDIDDDAVEGMLKDKSKVLTEGKSVSINASASEYDEAARMLHEKDDDAIEVIDVNADTLEHLKNKTDYVGQYILTCRRCRSNRFIEVDLLEADEDDPDLYNVADECPNCHSEGVGFELVGQVGKVQKDEPEAEAEGTEVEPVAAESEEEPTLENDLESDEATFDNDLETSEEETTETETEETAETDTADTSEEEDLSRFEEEEIDGMETTSSEDDDLDTESANLGDEVEETVTDDDNEDVSEAFKPDSNILEMNKYAEEAWLMNKVISSMNNEEAYYGSWLYYWPDGCDEEECAVTFNDKEAFEELRTVFEKVYKAYHEDELFDADAETLEYAHKQDKQLGLRAIENLKPRFKEQLTESFDNESLKDLFDLIVDINDVKLVEVYDSKSGKKVFEGPCYDLTPDIKASKLVKFSVGTNESIDFDISSDVSSDNAPLLKDILKLFAEGKNNIGLFELLDDGDVEERIVKDSKDAIERFGKTEVICIQQPRVLKLFMECPQMVALEEVEKDATEKLVEAIFKANNLSEYKINKINTAEYWINESIYSGEDLGIIFEEYVRDHQELVYEFKKLTGFRTKLEEQFMEEHDVGSLEDLYEQLYHVVLTEAEETEEVTDAQDTDDASEKDDSDTDIIVESSDDPYDRIYNDLITLFKDKGFDVNDANVKAYLEAAVEEIYDVYGSVDVWFENMETEYPEDLQKLKKLKEDLNREPRHQDIIDWLSDHEIAYEDAELFFDGTPLSEISTEELISWIADHDQLYDDFKNFFEYEDLDECKSIKESIEVETIADYIVDHYDFDDIDDKYGCINSIKDSFKDEKTISKEELEQFIGAHNGRNKVTESVADDKAKVRSFKNRKELAEAIEECKNNTKPYTVKRSTTPGYRYDLVEDDNSDTESESSGNPDANAEEVIDKLKNAPNYEAFVKILNSDGKSKAFIDYLNKHYKNGDDSIKTIKQSGASEGTIKCSSLVPTQNNISLSKSLGMISGNGVGWAINIINKPTEAFNDPTITYAGKYIIDGHHRWSKAYALNGGDCSIKVLNFPAISGVTWEDMLKATQLAIVSANPSANLVNKVKNDNMLQESKESIVKFVVDNIDDKVVQALVDKGRGTDKESVADKIGDNCMEMQKTSQPVANAPARDFMPQTDQAEGSLDKLSTSVIDLTESDNTNLPAARSRNTDIELAGTDGALVSSEEAKKALNRIKDVSDDIAEAIKKYYNIDADPRLIVADIIQDLSLISGHIKPEDLADTAVNNLTIQMYHDYNSFYSFFDALMSAATGESVVTTPEQKFKQALQILDGPAFSKETIDKTIASDRFLTAVQQGAVPYIASDSRPQLTVTEEVVCEKCHKSPCECPDPDKHVVEEDFSDSRYEGARDELLNTLADHNFDISDKGVKTFVGNQLDDFIYKFELDTDAWFDYVSTTYKSTLDSLQKLDYLDEDLDDFNPDDAASDFIDGHQEDFEVEQAALQKPERYVIKVSTLVSGDHGKQEEEMEQFIANSKEEADAKYEELIASQLYDEVELPVRFFAEDFSTSRKTTFDSPDHENWLNDFEDGPGSYKFELEFEDVETEVYVDDEYVDYETDVVLKVSPRDMVEALEIIMLEKDPRFARSNFDSEEARIKAFEALINEGDTYDAWTPFIEEYEEDLLDYFEEAAKDAASDKFDYEDYLDNERALRDDHDYEDWKERQWFDESKKVDVDFDVFVEELNNYFDENYEDTVLFNTTDGTVHADGKIMLEGVLTNEHGETSVRFDFEPETPLTEALTTDTINEKLYDITFNVSNNLSEEVFKFKFSK